MPSGLRQRANGRYEGRIKYEYKSYSVYADTITETKKRMRELKEILKPLKREIIPPSILMEGAAVVKYSVDRSQLTDLHRCLPLRNQQRCVVVHAFAAR